MGIKLNGSTGFLEYTDKLVSTFPATVAIWVAMDGASDAFAVSQTKVDGDSDLSMFFLSNGVTKLARQRNTGNGSNASIDSNNSATFKLAMAVYTSASNRRMYFGTSTPGAADTTALIDDVSGHNRFLVGAQKGNSAAAALFLNAAVAELSVFNVALTATDFENMRTDAVKGEAVAGCVAHWDLQSITDLTDRIGGKVLTITGGVTNETARAHPVSRVTPVAVSFSGPVPTRNGIIGTAASFANAGFFAGNQTPFAYSNFGTSLPAGLSLNTSTGIISGTPTTAATTSGIVIRATDAASNVANTNSYSIVIAASNAAPTFPGNISNISGTNGSAITPVNVSGQFSDTDALAYSASSAGTAWPSGMTINSSTGIISGTSSTTATTTGCKVRATDTAAQTVDSNAFNFVIAAAPVAPTVTIGTTLCHSQGGLPMVSVAGSIAFYNKTNLALAPLAVKSGLTTSSTGTLSPFAQTGLTAGTEVLWRWTSDADPLDTGFDFTTPA